MASRSASREDIEVGYFRLEIWKNPCSRRPPSCVQARQGGRPLYGQQRREIQFLEMWVFSVFRRTSRKSLSSKAPNLLLPRCRIWMKSVLEDLSILYSSPNSFTAIPNLRVSGGSVYYPALKTVYMMRRIGSLDSSRPSFN